jgi:ADP-ribosyl-[dinitrogen reductase] hydrolase
MLHFPQRLRGDRAMKPPTRKDRAQGAIMGSLIGDALGLGCHWYYDLKAMRRDFPDWVDDYHDGLPGRDDQYGYVAKWRHELGLRAGDLTQTGQIAVQLLESFAQGPGYNEADFCARLDQLFTTLDGTELSGRYTDHAVRDTWANRKSGTPWGSAGSRIDTAEAAIWNVVHAAHSDGDMRSLAIDTHSCVNLTHNEPYITGCSTVFVLAVAAVLNQINLEDLQRYMWGLRDDDEIRARTSSNDITFQIGSASARMGADSESNIDPVSACRVIGMNCTMSFQVPSAYFLLHRFPDDFEQAVLTAVNAGGNTSVRAALTGALVGARVGLQGIPKRLIDGLSDHDHFLGLCDRITG